jgi:hypothetical protein
VTFTNALAGTNVVQTTVDSSQIQTMSGTTDIEATDTQGTSMRLGARQIADG